MKNLFYPLLFAAVTVSSCSQNDFESTMDGTSSSDEMKLNVASALTKGSDVTTASLEESKVILLHIKDQGTIARSYKFVANGSDWGLETKDQVKWDNISFPASFFSAHDGEEAKALTLGDEGTTLDYEVSGDADNHKDLVYHASKLASAPAGGVINAFHKHALSKVNILAATGTNTITIARVQLKNVDGNGKMTIIPSTTSDGSKSTVDWKNGDSNNAFYQYQPLTSGTDAVLQSSDGNTAEENKLINCAEGASMMIIPQTTTATTAEIIAKAAEDGSAISGTYIEVIYYLVDLNGLPVVGYPKVSAMKNGGDYIDNDQDKVLYVKAAFPLTQEFIDNNQYNITLGLGKSSSTGGLLVDDFYVDKDGNAVTLTKKDGGEETKPEVPEIKPGEEILPDGNDDLDITVSVDPWGAENEIECK